jgi:hypothetical protein
MSSINNANNLSNNLHFDIELLIFILIVLLSLIGFYLKYTKKNDILIVISNILFILYGLFMSITK